MWNEEVYYAKMRQTLQDEEDNDQDEYDHLVMQYP